MIRSTDVLRPPVLTPAEEAEEQARLARRRPKAAARAAALAQIASADKAIRDRVQPGLRPPAGRLFVADPAGLFIAGPLGGIGVSERLARTLAPLSPGGRHAATVLMTAGGWADEATMRVALDGIAGKLGALGLVVNWRKAGVRMAKVRS